MASKARVAPIALDRALDLVREIWESHSDPRTTMIKRMMIYCVALGLVALPAALFADEPERANALKALRALNAATEVGVTYREYGSRLIDTKIAVDDYLRSTPAGAPGRGEIILALLYFVNAQTVWGLVNTARAHRMVYPEESIRALEQDPCPHLAALRQTATALSDKTDARLDAQNRLDLAIQAIAVPTVWRCAADKLREAEIAG